MSVRKLTSLSVGTTLLAAMVAAGAPARAQTPGDVLTRDEARGGDSEKLEISRGGVPADAIPDALRSRIRRAVGETAPTPDVLELESGRELEVYFLQAFGRRLVFYLKEDERTYARHEILRSRARSVRYGEYLPRDASEPLSIHVAEKQPVPKGSPLAGTFRGWQDRSTHWTFTFYSENHKPGAWTEDATDHGTFLLTSRRRIGSYEGKTRTTGAYSLYAPRTVNNADWVLALTHVGHGETDETDHKSWVASSLPDDLLIVRFSAGDHRFRLLWSNRSSGAWSALPQVEFRKESAEPRDPSSRPSLPPRVQRAAPSRTGDGGPLSPRPAAIQVQASDSQSAHTWVTAVGRDTEGATFAALRHRRTVFAVGRLNIGHRTDGWLRPTGYWVK